MRTEQALEEKTRSNPLRDESWQVLTIPKHYYTDPSILEREKEKIFSRSWQYAGHACHLPEIGSYFTVEFLNDSFLFVRDTERTIRGFYNVCQHRAHRLVNGQGCKKILTCPYHAWSYGLDGKLRSARGTDRGAGKFDIASYGLEPVRVEMLNDIIMFNMDPAAPSFESLVPGVAEELRQEIPRLSEFTMDKQPEGFGGSILDCNWKVLVDNCTECYHCVPSHPAFVDLIDMNTYQIKLHQIHAKHSAKIRRTDSEKAYSLTLTEGAEDFLVWHIWPNITIAKLPGATGLGVFVVDPLGVTQCRSRGHFFRLPTPETTEEAARREYVAKVLFPEDERICESVQLGLGSRGYRRGPFVAPDACDGGSEATVRLFQRLNLEALGEVA
ncbi:MAG: carnitine monooxygenase subunit [Rhodospirillaceae bacterium]|jgi:phenylpropionate dioxygenase-like ring-hydroxylating dioxygenase large terminal subunit|nr:carnitine monooxygenase subunit [Rhodospirillaceae bacterium]